MSFKQYINEDMVNYHHYTKQWQVRDNTGRYKHQTDHVIIKNPSHHIDYDRKEAGNKLHTYMTGDIVKKLPAGLKSRKIEYSSGDHPFIHSDDKTPVTKAKYVSMSGNQIHAHY